MDTRRTATLIAVAILTVCFGCLQQPSPAPDNGDLPRMGIDAVFHEFGHGFQGIGLGAGNNADSIPVIGDA